MGAISNDQMLLNTPLMVDADGKPYVYQLYTPEEKQIKDPNMYLWIRRCELFVRFQDIMDHLRGLGIRVANVDFRHDLFPELITITDIRGFRWYCCKAPIHGVVYGASTNS